jgi:hypothetical protein
MRTYLFRKMHRDESLLNESLLTLIDAFFEGFPPQRWSLTSTVKAHGVESAHVNHPTPNHPTPNNPTPNNPAPNNPAPNNPARKALR